MVDILNIGGKLIFDDRTVKFEFHTYNPYVNTTFGYSNEIKIPIQQQDLYTLLYESILFVESRLTSMKKNVQKQSNFGCNCVAFMFDMKFDMNSMEIDRNRNVGITNLMKGFAMFSNEIAYSLHNAEFIDSSDTEKPNDRRWILSFLCTAQHIVGLLRGLQT